MENIIKISNLSLFHGKNHILKNISLNIEKNKIHVLLGNDNHSVTSFIKCLNMTNTINDDFDITGEILYEGKNILDKTTDTSYLRRNVAMIFDRPVLFNSSIYENMAYALKYYGVKNKKDRKKIINEALEEVNLYEDVMGIINSNVETLTKEQQQKLCIARSITLSPKVIMLNNPTSTLDISSTLRMEEIIYKLKKKYTVILIPSTLQQARKLADNVTYFENGEMVETNTNIKFFSNPTEKQSENFITGRVT